MKAYHSCLEEQTSHSTPEMSSLPRSQLIPLHHSHTNGHPTAMEPMTKSVFLELLLLLGKNVAPLLIQSRSDLPTHRLLRTFSQDPLSFLFLLFLKGTFMLFFLYTNIHHLQNSSPSLTTRRTIKGTGSRLCFRSDKLLFPIQMMRSRV